MRALRRFLAAAVAAVSLPAGAGQYTDLWWNPQESGWGVGVVQQLETAFVTLYVYGPDGRPEWLVGPATEVIAYGAGGLPLFAGPLYRTRGPWHGGPFDPGQVQAVRVGDISLEVLARDRIRVHYAADGVQVTREVVRQTWQPELLAANYAAQFVLRLSQAGGGPIGTSEYQAEVLAHFDAEGYLRVVDHLGRRCDYRGPWKQSGKLLAFSGTFECTAGDALAGTFEIAELEVTSHGVTGLMQTWSGGLRQYGRFAGVRR